MTLYPCRFPFRASLGRGIQDREMTSGDLATARTFSGGRDGTEREGDGVDMWQCRKMPSCGIFTKTVPQIL